MGFFKKIIRKVTKPVSKVLDKIVPNEVKPFLPYAAAFAPFIAPGIMGTSVMQRALMGGGMNIFGQLASVCFSHHKLLGEMATVTAESGPLVYLK